MGRNIPIKRCGKCKTVNPQEANYCGHCGRAFSDSDTYSVYSDKYVRGLRLSVYELTTELETAIKNLQRFSVTMTSLGTRKVTVARRLATLLGCAEEEAKGMVANMPCVVTKDLYYDEAIGFKKSLESYGAKLRLDVMEQE